MDIFGTLINNLPYGVTIPELIDLCFVICFGAMAGGARELYDTYQIGLPTSAKELVARMFVGIVGAMLGSEIAWFAFQNGDLTWAVALATGWSGGRMLNVFEGMIEALVGKKFQNPERKTEVNVSNSTVNVEQVGGGTFTGGTLEHIKDSGDGYYYLTQDEEDVVGMELYDTDGDPLTPDVRRIKV